MSKILLILLFLLNFITPSLESKTKQVDVLGRTKRLDIICENFESNVWSKNYNKNNAYWHATSNPSKRGPELLELVPPPSGRKPGSSQALKISRISDPKQQELLSPAFAMKLGRNLTRSDQPVFVVRIWLPPFDKWGQAYGFGFRQQTHASNISNISNNEFSTSIWVKKNQNGINFYFRAANGSKDDLPSRIIVKPGWWTLAIAFDVEGIGHYYISKGTNIPTTKDEVFSTTRFPTPNNPLMDDVAYSYFAISAITGFFNMVPQFIVDDYEVWVIN